VLAYFDCFSGISGDMTLGAFIDSGVPVERLQHDLSRLPIEPFTIKVTPVERHGIRATLCDIQVPEAHSHRALSDIRRMIDKSGLPDSVKASALSIFHRLASAEAGIHGCSIEAVRFHEVGAADAILDIVGCCLCLDYLGISRVEASALPQGHGFVDCHHGRLPLPAPATLAILKDIPVYGMAVEGELVTPTGAAIIATLGKTFGPIPAMSVSSIGYGAGHREYSSHPNLLRIVMGSAPANRRGSESDCLTDTVHVIETTIDDMNPEIFSYLMEALFDGGALDVYWIPVYMKKNRPATLVQVLCHAPQVISLRDILFKETTTIGMRVSSAHRWMLPRETITMGLSMGRVTVKKITLPDGEIRWVPEFEDCRRVARAEGLPIRRVYEQIAREAPEAAAALLLPATDH
jgi:pyridinium-3,5-bisthiocarboxylic acid mononucleotide nickel chelatase